MCQTEGRLKQLQDDYDTLSEQAQFSQSRNEELEASLDRSAEDLRRAIAAGTARACVTQCQLLDIEARLFVSEEGRIEAERRAEGEEFFKLAQESVSERVEEACAQREQQIECLVEELGAAHGYAEGLRALLAARQEGQEEAACQEEWMVEGTVEVESREAMVGGAVMCRELMEENETAVEKMQGLEQTVDELVGDEDRLVEEVCGLQHRIQELEVRKVGAWFVCTRCSRVMCRVTSLIRASPYQNLLPIEVHRIYCVHEHVPFLLLPLRIMPAYFNLSMLYIYVVRHTALDPVAVSPPALLPTEHV